MLCSGVNFHGMRQLGQELQEQGMALAAGPSTLPEPGKQCPATGHCTTTMQLITNCFFADVCPKPVTISKLP